MTINKEIIKQKEHIHPSHTGHSGLGSMLCGAAAHFDLTAITLIGIIPCYKKPHSVVCVFGNDKG